jgi:hypothetical protein
MSQIQILENWLACARGETQEAQQALEQKSIECFLLRETLKALVKPKVLELYVAVKGDPLLTSAVYEG